MKRSKKCDGCTFFLVAVLLVGCSVAEKKEKEIVTEQDATLGPGEVARIDTMSIGAQALRSFVDRLPPNLRFSHSDSQTRQSYLRSLLAQRLIELEANRRGLDTALVVRTKLDPQWRQHLIEAYRQKVLADRVEVSEEEIRRFFTKNGLDRKRQMAGILVPDDSTAQAILERLGAGEDFAKLAEEYTIDRRSSIQGGLLGFITIDQARKLQVPDEVFFNLPVGKVSPVLPMGKRYQIVLFHQDQTVAFEEQRQPIYDSLYEYKLWEEEQKQVRLQMDALEWRLVPEGLSLLLETAQLYERLRREHLSPEEATQVLFAYKGGEVNLGDYIDAIWTDMRAMSGWGLADSASVVQAAKEVLLGQLMLFEAAKQEGIPALAVEKSWFESRRKKLMIEQLRREEAVKKAAASPAETKTFYEENPDLFREPAKYTLVEVLVPTEEEALTLRQALDRGETLSSLAQQHTLRPNMKEEAGLTHLGEYERLTQPLLYKAVQTAEANQIVGPVEVKEGFSLFKVLHQQGGELLPFKQVEAKARAFVRGQKKERLFEEMVDGLLEKYAGQIEVSQKELAAALPDSFLQRLAQENQPKSDE